MSKNSEHNVKIVWDDPSQEVNYPRRDFKSVNRRIVRRKWLIRVAVGAITSMVALGIYLIVNLSHKPEPLPETPTNASPIGPFAETALPFDWSVIDSIAQKKPEASTPEVQVLAPVKEVSPIPTTTLKEEETLVIETEDVAVAISTDSIQSDQIVSSKNLTEIKDSVIQTPAPSFVPSEFVRAFPTVGYDSLYRYLTEYINKELLGTNNKADTLKISFAIEVDGRPSGIKLSISTTDSVFMRIEEVVQNMPAWQPATADGQPIKTRFRLPLIIESKTIKED